MPVTIKLGDTGTMSERLRAVFARIEDRRRRSAVERHFGPQTEQAVKDFQQSDGLTVDGVAGPVTWSHIPAYREASPALQAGSLGAVVAMLQGVLKNGFGYAGAVDGVFGPGYGERPCGSTRPTMGSCGQTGVRMDERTWMAPAGAAGATLGEPLGPGPSQLDRILGKVATPFGKPQACSGTPVSRAW